MSRILPLVQSGTYVSIYVGPEGIYTFLMDISARPFGVTGNGPLDWDAFKRRYLGGIEPPAGAYPQGMAAELYPVNMVAASRAIGGVATLEEAHDLAVSIPRNSVFYQTHYWQANVGGSVDKPIIIKKSNFRTYASLLKDKKSYSKGEKVSIKETLNSWPIHFYFEEDVSSDSKPEVFANVPTLDYSKYIGDEKKLRALDLRTINGAPVGFPVNGQMYMARIPESFGVSTLVKVTNAT